MKTTKLINLKKNILPGIFAMIFIFSLFSCATSVNFLNSSVVPAARGSVKIKTDNNKTTLFR